MNLGDIELPTVSARMVEEGWKFLKGEVLMKNSDTAMEGHINLNNHRIVNLDLPVHRTANKQYVDRQISKPILTIVAEKRGALGGSEFQGSFGSNLDGNSHRAVGYVVMKKRKDTSYVFVCSLTKLVCGHYSRWKVSSRL